MTITPNTDTGRRRGIRCGWCLNSDHANCAVAIQMGAPATPKDGGSRGVWRCPCDCNNGTRCVDCRRRGVEVDAASRCVDADECRLFRQERRNQDPGARVIDEITAEQAAHQRAPRTPKEPKDKTGQCLCCGGATRGGKFLPGHDARYVSQQAALYVAPGPEGDDTWARDLYSRMEALGPKLHAKFIKRVEALRASK